MRWHISTSSVPVVVYAADLDLSAAVSEMGLNSLVTVA